MMGLMAAGNLKLSMHHLLKFIIIKYFFSIGSNKKNITIVSCGQCHLQSVGFVSMWGGINHTCQDVYCCCFSGLISFVKIFSHLL